MKVQVVGVSSSAHCGVRRYAEALSSQLREHGLGVTSTWGDLPRDGSAIEPWLNEVERTAAAMSPEAQLWHYSVFTLSHRGVPIRVPGVAQRLRNCRGRVVVVLHEFAYPWRRRGIRGAILAATQRAALIVVLWAADAAIATTDARVAWLRSRRWLPKRPLHLAPVFSTVPVDPADVPREESMVVVFGYAAEGTAADIVVAALAQVHERRKTVQLLLLGAPGADDPAADRWRAAAAKRSVPLTFTGPVSNAELSKTLKSATVCVIPDQEGLSSRRTTTASVLAHGCAAVAFAGPETWRAASQAGAVAEVPLRAEALADQVMVLLEDAEARRALGKRAAAFYYEEIGPDGVARTVRAVLRSLSPSSSA